MDKKLVKKQYNKRVILVRYLRWDGLTHIIVDTVEGEIRRYRESDFHPYYSSRDATKIFYYVKTSEKFKSKDDQTTQDHYGGWDEQ